MFFIQISDLLTKLHNFIEELQNFRVQYTCTYISIILHQHLISCAEIISIIQSNALDLLSLHSFLTYLHLFSSPINLLQTTHAQS